MLIWQAPKVLEAVMAAGHVDSEKRNATRLILLALHATVLTWCAMDMHRDQIGWTVANWKESKPCMSSRWLKKT